MEGSAADVARDRSEDLAGTRRDIADVDVGRQLDSTDGRIGRNILSDAISSPTHGQ
jgi:hypothetical protein